MKKSSRQSAPQPLPDQLELFQLIFDNTPSGAMVTDPNGIVTHLNKPYADFLGMEVKKSIGKHCTEVAENSRMHIVGRTGIAEINQIQMIKGQNIVVHRIPLEKDGKVVAVFGLVMFQDATELSRLSRKLHSLESKVMSYEKELISLRSTRFSLESIIGTSRAIADLKKQALLAAAGESPVLITGESGTGKELFAQAIHNAGRRKPYHFIQINCAAIPGDLFETELFGYDRGAFTGALANGKPGKFELADHGTIFLDEIGDLPLAMQPKLLRVLEEKYFERVGGNKLIGSDFRLIAATNQDLEALVAKGNFRKDLYYRLNVIWLHIPPLRERPEDIGPLSRHLLNKLGGKSGRPEAGIGKGALEVLAGHAWPGNVRELSNVLERALMAMHGDSIHEDDLPLHKHRGVKRPMQCIRDVKAEAEKMALIEALERSGYSKTKAAALLGIHRTQLYKKLKKHSISL